MVHTINLDFKGDLRDYQKNIVSTYLGNVDKVKGGGGSLEIPCGRGKTVMALKLIEQLKTKTLVIVHKSFLLDQWIERIQQFLPEARVGKIQGQIIDIDNKDISDWYAAITFHERISTRICLRVLGLP